MAPAYRLLEWPDRSKVSYEESDRIVRALDAERWPQLPADLREMMTDAMAERGLSEAQDKQEG